MEGEGEQEGCWQGQGIVGEEDDRHSAGLAACPAQDATQHRLQAVTTDVPSHQDHDGGGHLQKLRIPGKDAANLTPAHASTP